MKIGILKPEEAAKKALAKVAAFKKEKARKALEAKVRPAPATATQNPVVDAPSAELLPTNKKELNALLLENAKNGNGDEVERLLKGGADVNAKDNGGWTALMSAAYYEHTEIAGLLIQNKADVDAKDNDGETALIIAAANGRKEIVELLRASGAKE